jgi:hypothetical protein
VLIFRYPFKVLVKEGKNISSSAEVIKLLIDLYPDGVKENENEGGSFPLYYASASLLVALTREKILMKNIILDVTEAFRYINFGSRQSCLKAGASAALVSLSREKAVRDNGDAARWVAYSLGTISESESGLQSCVEAGAPSALVSLSREKAVKENGIAAEWVACALGTISESESGRQSCVEA